VRSDDALPGGILIACDGIFAEGLGLAAEAFEGPQVNGGLHLTGSSAMATALTRCRRHCGRSGPVPCLAGVTAWA